LACGDCGRPAAGIALRELSSDELTTPAASPVPLTVAEAAVLAGVKKRTIYRACPELAAVGGAWKIGKGSHWRIDPDALIRHRIRPKARKKSAATAAANPPVRPQDELGWPT